MKVFDCFSGIGGFRSAINLHQNADVNYAGFCEKDKYAKKTYSLMHKVHSDEIDISDICSLTRTTCKLLKKPNEIKKTLHQKIMHPDLFTAGFPCQPHSLMGNRKGKYDARGDVLYDMLALIFAMQPKNVILENVRAFRSVNNGSLFKELVEKLEKEYNVEIIELNAFDCGIPQVRRRVFILGSKIRNPCTSIEKENLFKSKYPSTWHLLEKNVNKKYYLSEKIKQTILADQHKGYSRRADINRLIARPLTRTMHKMHRASQDNYYSDAFINGEYTEKENLVKLTKKGSNNIRRITPLEAFRIQSFPENEIKNALESQNSDTQLYMQAGNAVPVLMAYKILKAIL
jgi:DNA (cytosine-5)-methyltransferase 1